MIEYLRWLRSQKVWIFILVSQVFVVALPSNHRLQYAFVLFWSVLASLFNHLSDTWKKMYFDEKEVSDFWKNRALNKQNPSNS